MNDFTKEELKLLGGCVFGKFISSLDDPSIHHLQPDLKKLRDKIQSMIENYCEHEKMVPNYDCKTQCDKCGEIF